ncbi:P-loop containing nucleoside triphosphate hydrolase protein [Annulohypoxylon bovei var. microspora]|nr:P-loop containing nucleoside triphosphate hydrolase protein [Annulohypoxylon bovei var. microspora]
MEAFFAHNPGIPSRIPIQLEFKDYEDEELLKILNYQLEKNQNSSKNKDWLKLKSMIGLGSVKQSAMALMNRLQTNYDRETKEQPLVERSLNKVFIGNPGTGKTTVAKLYGKILRDLGLVSNGEVIVKSPADFVGNVLGQSEKNTKAILDSTKGKVLIIDEAYMLASGVSNSGGTSDPYKAAVIDTIVAEVQSTALEDRCVLLLGYKGQMEDMFQKVNPGLTRRFPISTAGEAAKKVVLEVLKRARNKPNFGNAGEVDNVLDQAKGRQQRRLSEFSGNRNVDLLEPEDIDPEFDRSERAGTNIRMLFKDVVGCDDIVEQLEGYQQVAQNMKTMDMDPVTQIPFGFLFRGPLGTGKTTTARKMGKVYYDMKFLAEASVVECSATDLIGQFVGQAGPKVQKKFDEALGRVLFIDEAYRLAEGHFAKEAMDEIVDCLTKEKYQNKLVVILAGYDNDTNRLMNQNPGLTNEAPEKAPAKPASIRDAGVSDAVWSQLQRDKLACEQRQRELASSRRKATELERKVREQEEALKRQKDEVKRREELRKLEQARVKRDLEERQRREREERMKRELEVKAWLKRMGCCPAGFEWVLQCGGHRCAGGSHWMADGDLGL